MITLDQVTVRFGPTTVLQDISLRVRPGETVALLGPSGIGKTTILRLIARLIQPDQGNVRVDTERIGYVFQEPRLLPWRKAWRNIALPLQATGLDRAQAAYQSHAWLKRVGLAQAADQYPNQLSGGMRQRVALARALAIQPTVLLLDEPFSSLDSALKAHLLGLTAQMLRERQMTTVYVTHDRHETGHLANRIVQLVAPDRLLEQTSNNRRAGN